jgi:hypothetical protein
VGSTIKTLSSGSTAPARLNMTRFRALHGPAITAQSLARRKSRNGGSNRRSWANTRSSRALISAMLAGRHRRAQLVQSVRGRPLAVGSEDTDTPAPQRAKVGCSPDLAVPDRAGKVSLGAQEEPFQTLSDREAPKPVIAATATKTAGFESVAQRRTLDVWRRSSGVGRLARRHPGHQPNEGELPAPTHRECKRSCNLGAIVIILLFRDETRNIRGGHMPHRDERTELLLTLVHISDLHFGAPWSRRSKPSRPRQAARLTPY